MGHVEESLDNDTNESLDVVLFRRRYMYRHTSDTSTPTSYHTVGYTPVLMFIWSGWKEYVEAHCKKLNRLCFYCQITEQRRIAQRWRHSRPNEYKNINITWRFIKETQGLVDLGPWITWKQGVWLSKNWNQHYYFEILVFGKEFREWAKAPEKNVCSSWFDN